MPATHLAFRRYAMILVAWVATVTLLAACAPGVDPTADPTPDPTPSPVDEAPDNGEGDEATVEISGFAFETSELTISTGTTVTFENNDNARHTATHGSNGATDPDALFDESLDAGASATVTFDEAGTYPVTCTLHPNMNMTITVED